MDYCVVVRSFKRYDQVCTDTLTFLRENNLLEKTVLLVADEKERELYTKSLKMHGLEVSEIVVTCPGGGESHVKFFSSKPDGEKFFCIDDDIQELYEYFEGHHKAKRPIRNLKEYIDYGFTLCEKYSTVAFSFEYTNMFYKQGKEFATVLSGRFPAGFFGLINCKEARTPKSSHEDDNIRAAYILNTYGRVVLFNWIGVKMRPMGKNPGGMQEGNMRENTLQLCKKTIEDPIVRKFFQEEPIFSEKADLYTLKFKNKKGLKASEVYLEPIKIKGYFQKPPISLV